KTGSYSPSQSGKEGTLNQAEVPEQSSDQLKAREKAGGTDATRQIELPGRLRERGLELKRPPVEAKPTPKPTVPSKKGEAKGL
ncbi:MAG: hypothetical protein U0Y68_27680, partial [Blastocatellia bacterium]